MEPATLKAARQDRILAELSELGLALARDLQACALAADDVAVKSELSLGFQRASRAVRQALALEAKLERDRQRDARDVQADAIQVREDRGERRKAQVRFAVKRCVLDVYDGFDADNLLSDLEERLEEDGLHDLFAGEDDIDVHIARLCEELSVPHPGYHEATVEAQAANLAADAPGAMATQANPSAKRRSSG